MLLLVPTLALASDPPPPRPDLVAYVRCDRADTLLAVPSLVDAVQGLVGQKLAFDAPEIVDDRPVVLLVGSTAELWLPMAEGKTRPSGSERGGGTWTSTRGWATLSSPVPPVLADVPKLGDLRIERSPGCLIVSGVAPEDPMRSNGDRVLMHLDPKDPDHLALRHVGADLPEDIAAQSAAKPKYPAAARGTFATASYARLNLAPASAVGPMVESELPELHLAALVEALGRMGRPPLTGTEIAQGPEAKPSFVVMPFKRSWKPKDVQALATELATSGRSARIDAEILVLDDALFVGAVKHHLVISDDRHAVEDFVAGRGGSLLGPTFRGLVETPGMILFKNGAYGDGPTTWVSLDPKGGVMQMTLQQPGLFGMLGQTAIPGVAHLAGRVLDATPPRPDQLYSKAGPVTIRGDEPKAGAKDGRFLVVEFMDFGCPHCAQTSEELPGFLEENPDVSLVTKIFPLTGACNPGLQDRGEDRCFAAVAARCAQEQGRFAEMAAVLFGSEWLGAGADTFAGYADRIGVDKTRFATCAADPGARASVVDDAKAGEAAGVDGTPTFFVKGAVADPAVWVRVDGRLEDLDLILKAARGGANLPPP